METYKRLNIDKFNSLDKTGYMGYYWYSDKTDPVNNLSDLKLSENQVPFIIEGYLYNENTQESISIKNYNGEYCITKFNINEIDKNEEKLKLSDTEEKVPAINKIANNKNIKIRRLQEKITDDLGFYSWKDVADIFVGFEEKTNSKN